MASNHCKNGNTSLLMRFVHASVSYFFPRACHLGSTAHHFRLLFFQLPAMFCELKPSECLFSGLVLGLRFYFEHWCVYEGAAEGLSDMRRVKESKAPVSDERSILWRFLTDGLSCISFAFSISDNSSCVLHFLSFSDMLMALLGLC